MHLKHREVIKPIRLKFHIEDKGEWFYNEDNVPISCDIKPEQELNFDRSDKRRRS